MNVSFKVGEELGHGWEITDRNGLTHYTATSKEDGIVIFFHTDAGGGINYSRIIGMYDTNKDVRYKAGRYLLKYVALVQNFSNMLYKKYRMLNTSK